MLCQRRALIDQFPDCAATLPDGQKADSQKRRDHNDLHRISHQERIHGIGGQYLKEHLADLTQLRGVLCNIPGKIQTQEGEDQRDDDRAQREGKAHESRQYTCLHLD